MQITETTTTMNNGSIWRQAMRYVLFGLMMSCVSFDVLLLGYILPSVGLVLQWIGFRMLKQETKWFYICWVCTSVEIAIQMIMLCINATIWNAVIIASAPYQVMAVIKGLLAFTILVGFMFGLRDVRTKLEQDIHTSAAMWLIIWYIVIFVLAMMQLSILGWIFLIAYFVIFYKLFQFVDQVDEAGYMAVPVAVRLSDKWFVSILIAVLVVGMGCGYLFFDQYPMNWSVISEDEQQSKIASETYAHLKALGMDEYVLQDLSAEDLALCKDAIRVYTEKIPVIANLKGEYQQDMLTLNFTNVVIELPSEKQYPMWRIIHHYQWSEPLDYYGTEGMQIWPTYMHRTNGIWGKASEATGLVWHDTSEQSYCAPYYALYEEEYQTTNLFGRSQTVCGWFAAFAYPKNSENCRGYVTYATKQYADDAVISYLNYAHQRKWGQYPVKSAVDYLKTTSYGYGSEMFFYTQNIPQIYPESINDEKTD